MKKIKMFVDTMNFPCLKEELVGRAEQHGLDKKSLDTLEYLPLEFLNSKEDVLENIIV